MEIVGGTASILTLLAAAGSACKFIYSVSLDLDEAPRDIKVQDARLRRLDWTIHHLTETYRKLPQDVQVEAELLKDVQSFKDEITFLKVKIENKISKLDRGRRQAVKESCKWILFDRQLEKFAESLDHWDKILSQMALAAQITLSIRIDDTTTTLLALTQSQSGSPTAAVGGCSSQSKHVLCPNSAFPPATPSLQQMSDGSTILKRKTTVHRSQRLSQYLSNMMDPAGICLHQWSTFRLGTFFTLRSVSGPAIVRKWSPNGQEVYRRLPARQGYAMSFTIQLTRFVPGRISVTWFGMFSDDQIPKVNLHSNLQWAGLFDWGGPSHKAIERGDEVYLRQELTSRRLRVYDVTTNGDTLLHLAAGHGQLTIMRFLVDSGADVNATNNKGDTPLHIALRNARDYECASLLLSRGADACREDKDGRTPLHSFFNEAIGQVIQCHQDDIDLASQDSRGMTALHWASWSSRSSPEDVACRTTRQHDPTFEARDVHGKSLLHFAVERGNLAVVDYLMLQPCAADMALPDYSGCTLLHYATANARVLLIDFLIDCKGFDPMVRDNHGRTLLHHAAMRDNFDAVKHLFDLGIARPESLDQDGRTALQLALSRGSTSVVKYLQTYCDTSAVEHFEKADEVSIAIGVQSTRKAAQSLSLAKATTLALLLSFLYWYQLQRVSNSRLS